MVTVNTHEPVGRDRCKLYINGFQNNYYSSQNDMSQNGETPMSGRARQMFIGLT